MNRLSFYNHLCDNNKKYFSSIVNIEADTQIMSENEKCGSILFLLTGEIDVYKYGVNGRQFNLYSILPGESCVLNMSCVLSDSKYMAFAKAKTNIECILLPSREFLDLFSKEEALRTYVFNLIATRLIEITTKVEDIVLDTVEHRLREVLSKKETKIIYTTHDELANDLGTAREVISRHLKKLENLGYIKIGRGKIEILKPLDS